MNADTIRSTESGVGVMESYCVGSRVHAVINNLTIEGTDEG